MTAIQNIRQATQLCEALHTHLEVKHVLMLFPPQFIALQLALTAKSAQLSPHFFISISYSIYVMAYQTSILRSSLRKSLPRVWRFVPSEFKQFLDILRERNERSIFQGFSNKGMHSGDSQNEIESSQWSSEKTKTQDSKGTSARKETKRMDKNAHKDEIPQYMNCIYQLISDLFGPEFLSLYFTVDLTEVKQWKTHLKPRGLRLGKKQRYTEINQKIETWLLQMVDSGEMQLDEIPISMIVEKGKQLKNDPHFKCSKGWADKLKTRVQQKANSGNFSLEDISDAIMTEVPRFVKTVETLLRQNQYEFEAEDKALLQVWWNELAEED